MSIYTSVSPRIKCMHSNPQKLKNSELANRCVIEDWRKRPSPKRAITLRPLAKAFVSLLFQPPALTFSWTRILQNSTHSGLVCSGISTPWNGRRKTLGITAGPPKHMPHLAIQVMTLHINTWKFS